jgi:hypothetical protein
LWLFLVDSLVAEKGHLLALEESCLHLLVQWQSCAQVLCTPTYSCMSATLPGHVPSHPSRDHTVCRWQASQAPMLPYSGSRPAEPLPNIRQPNPESVPVSLPLELDSLLSVQESGTPMKMGV